jgi:hypothetical protein
MDKPGDFVGCDVDWTIAGIGVASNHRLSNYPEIELPTTVLQDNQVTNLPFGD